MVDPAAVGHVARVLGDPLDRRVGVVAAVGAQRAGVEVDADQAAARRDRVELVVGQVARRRAERVDARVRGDQRPVELARDVPEPGGVEVAEVDGDAELGAAPHELDAGVREARAGVGRGRVAERHAVPERVGAAPDRAERAQPGRVPDLERVEVGVDRLGALHVEDHAERVAGQAGVEVGDVAHEPDRAVRRAQQPHEARAERADRASGLLPGHAGRVRDLPAARGAGDPIAAGRRQHGEQARRQPARTRRGHRDRRRAVGQQRIVGGAVVVEARETSLWPSITGRIGLQHDEPVVAARSRATRAWVAALDRLGERDEPAPCEPSWAG